MTTLSIKKLSEADILNIVQRLSESNRALDINLIAARDLIRNQTIKITNINKELEEQIRSNREIHNMYEKRLTDQKNKLIKKHKAYIKRKKKVVEYA